MKKNRSDMGSTIIGLANVIAIVYAVVMGLSGIVTMISGAVLAGIVYIVSGLLMAYILYITIYGFGQLIEDNRAMRENSDKLVRHFLGKEENQTGNFGSGAAGFTYQSVTGARPGAAEGDSTAKSDTKYCTNCGTAIAPGRDTCWKCGEKL